MKEDFDKLFPDVRETGENSLKQTQLVMLRLLKIFHYLCEKHNVKYFLIGGSSIGAIRHGGFIPWDDDLDVGITRDNYNLFLEKCVPELPYDIFFQNEKTDKYYPKFDFVDAKLRDKYSRYIHHDGKILDFHDGLQLDIFIYDKAFIPSKLGIILQNMLVNKLSKDMEQRVSILKLIKRILPVRTVYANNWQHNLGMMKVKVGPTYIYEEEIDELLKVKFEDSETYVPVKYDEVLKRQFGNYMQLPPENKRVSHHNVDVDAFTPCNHSEVLNWKTRNKN